MGYEDRFHTDTSTLIITSNNDISLFVRGKRHEHNIVVEETLTSKAPHWIVKESFDKNFDEGGAKLGVFDETSRSMQLDDKKYERNERESDMELKRQSDEPHLQYERNRKSEMHHSNPWNSNTYENDYITRTHKHDKAKASLTTLKLNEEKERNIHKYYEKLSLEGSSIGSAEKDYALYEIGSPDLWYAVQVQLFEKLSTPEGKTVWNDMTKGQPASVSSLSPEWTGQDINIRYRPAEWVTRDEFTLPMTSLCLLAPIGSVTSKAFDNTSISDEGYIVIPGKDIVELEDDNESTVNKRNDNNYSSLEVTTKRKSDKCHRRVIVRVSRALFGGSSSAVDRLRIASQGEDEYLTLPHRRSHNAQIDLEARADENQLVLVGSSGRISVVVADSTRRTRTVLSLQATNTGLAAARFRAVARDCGPELSDLMNRKGREPICSAPMLLPPRHTRRLHIEVPIEIPIDVAHCSVALVNDDDESVAVREVSIKKGDRCFCVWHCECVCLSDDPKLLCRDMAESRQTAAGLSLRERPRHARSLCYHDVVSLNILITIIGVIMVLLLLGLGKAIAGLVCRCVGSWGLDRILHMPRKLDHYYESSLSSLPVVYDSEGWPVNPHTKKRTVRYVSRPMEFILNVIFFVTMPCLIIYDAVTYVVAQRNKSETKNDGQCCNKKNSKCFNAQDIQDQKSRLRRRRARLHRWMTPEAEDLSANIWRKGLTPQPSMQPLLQEQCCRGPGSIGGHESYVDSEQDDTDFVLMQMQKSRESLAKSQRKQNDSGLLSTKNQLKAEPIFKTIRH